MKKMKSILVLTAMMFAFVSCKKEDIKPNDFATNESSENKSFVERLMKKFVGSHKRKSLEEICPGGYNSKWPGWIKEALELAKLAPSAANKQPWRFIVSENNCEIKITVEDTSKLDRKKLDCGIAMLHIEIGALYNGIKGEWIYLEKSDIAAYRIN
jgi:hypothetical protein